MRTRLAVLVSLLVSFAVASSASAQSGPLITGLGGEAGFGAGVLDYNDDGSSAEIDLRPAFPNGLDYFGQRFSSFFVNNNGSVTFGQAVGSYTPEAFPLAGTRMIAPFWGDVDTRGGGRPSRNGVYWDIRPGRVIVTWHNVGYYGMHDDHQNTFQLVIESNALLDQDHIWRVELRYARCEWTTGDASGGSGGRGGTPAQAGFNAGDGQVARMLPGSRTDAVLSLCRQSNIGQPGVWIINIYNGMPQEIVPSTGGTQTYDFSGGGGAAPAVPHRRRRRTR
ncbi:MAG: hypothetical protein K1X94_01580 [Sandaracinaceae bacterium]|jgi:hypothetical protein|nr:hypothetical protein [Sandaracinaceae bacterium]